MDCRTSLLVALCLALGSGCVHTPQRLPQPNVPPQNPPQSFSNAASKAGAAQVAIQKPKDGPKRAPLPGTVVALAILKEREADKTQDVGLQRKLYDQARQFYQEALDIDASHRDAFQGLARVYTRLEDYDRAFTTYHKALEKNPKDHGLWIDLGMCHNRKKDFNEAIPCFQKALDLDPQNLQYIQTLGFTLARAGQTDQSLALLTRTMGAPLAHYNVARMMLHMGQADAGRQHLQIALQINPNLEPAQEMLASLNTPGGARPAATLGFIE